ncbi:hypothetical protein PMAYCL1PPCAC_25240, partial [Pristionchus mayeri]
DGQFRVEFDKIPSNILEHYRKASIEMEVKGITWQAALCLNFSGIDCNFFCLHEQMALWSVDMDTEFIVVNKNIEKNLTVKELINDGKIVVEIRFWISKMKGIRCIPRIDFTDPNDPRHDVALIFEGEK